MVTVLILKIFLDIKVDQALLINKIKKPGKALFNRPNTFTQPILSYNLATL